MEIKHCSTCNMKRAFKEEACMVCGSTAQKPKERKEVPEHAPTKPEVRETVDYPDNIKELILDSSKHIVWDDSADAVNAVTKKGTPIGTLYMKCGKCMSFKQASKAKLFAITPKALMLQSQCSTCGRKQQVMIIRHQFRKEQKIPPKILLVNFTHERPSFCVVCKQRTTTHNTTMKISAAKKPFVIGTCGGCGKQKTVIISPKEMEELMNEKRQ